jgi:hypothetical protein
VPVVPYILGSAQVLVNKDRRGAPGAGRKLHLLRAIYLTANVEHIVKRLTSPAGAVNDDLEHI